MEKKNIIIAIIVVLIIAIAGILSYNLYSANNDKQLKDSLTKASIVEKDLINTTNELKNYTETSDAKGAEKLKELVNKSQNLINQENEYLKLAETNTENQTEIEFINLQNKRLLTIQNIINSTNEFSAVVNKYINGETSLSEVIVATSNLKNSIEDNEKIYKDICSNIKTILEENPNLVEKLNEINATEGMYGEFSSNIIEID